MIKFQGKPPQMKSKHFVGEKESEEKVFPFCNDALVVQTLNEIKDEFVGKRTFGEFSSRLQLRLEKVLMAKKLMIQYRTQFHGIRTHVYEIKISSIIHSAIEASKL